MPSISLPIRGEVPIYEGDVERDLAIVSRNRTAEQITGGLSITTKMPCPSWGVSAFRCRVGSVLAKKEGSTCHACYATKGRYRFDAVQRKLEQRYQGLFHELWTPSLVFLVRWYADKYFRWFCSGDLQGENHLRNIVTVAEHTPDVRHWLPTREAATVRGVQAQHAFPPNLVVRVSGTMIDGKPPRGFPFTSGVVSDPAAASCPANAQGGHCGACRACWEEPHVSYRLH